MIKIKNKIFNSRDFRPVLSSESDEYKKEDKKIASDNITVKPVDISAFVFYAGADYLEAIEFLNKILYSRELIEIEDIDSNKIYTNMYIKNFNIINVYSTSKNLERRGFTSNITFGYVPITETATAGKTQYAGYSIRGDKVSQKPLLTVPVETKNLPLKNLNEIKKNNGGILDDVMNLKTLAFDKFEKGLNSVSQKIKTSIGEFTGIFELAENGGFNIYDSLGKPLSLGQKLLVDAELLANTIPGVNISMKVIPLSSSALNSIFTIDRLGKDFILNVSEIKRDISELGG